MRDRYIKYLESKITELEEKLAVAEDELSWQYPTRDQIIELEERAAAAEAEARGNLRLFLREKRIHERAPGEIYRRLMAEENRAVCGDVRKAYEKARAIVSEEWDKDPTFWEEDRTRVILS